MVGNTVQYTAQNNLCCGCGICKGICPKGCIFWGKKNGLYLPEINENLCVNCGLCASVCPGLGHTYEEKGTAVETITGPVQACFNAWSKDAELRHVSASGGVVSTIVRSLLIKGMYDGAFCLDSYNYCEQLKTRLFTAEEVDVSWSKSNAPKSRYLPVSHENAVLYMKSHRESKLVIVGTSCAIRGLLAAIRKLNLNREQYLFIGLFCDKVFNYNVLSYFEDTYAAGATLEALHFKNKESGGWPGDMKFFLKGGETLYVPLTERAKSKDYFVPERCLYCVDKLNACADISLGDNYTGKDDSPLGSNSVIIRSEVGMYVWSTVSSELEVRDGSIVDVQNAQAIDWRLNNLYFGDLGCSQIDLNCGVPREKQTASYYRAWQNSLRKLQTGAVYDADPNAIKRQIIKDNKKPNPAFQFIRRAMGFVRRRFMR